MTGIIERVTDRLTDGGTDEAAAVSAGAATAAAELELFVAPLTVPPVLRPDSADVREETEIALRPTWVRLHPQLPPTLMWGYDGSVPGPTIEVRRGQRVRIAWTNRIPDGGEYPVTAVECRTWPTTCGIRRSWSSEWGSAPSPTPSNCRRSSPVRSAR